VTFAAKRLLCARFKFALVAQLDRASDFESEGRRFESVRARQKNPKNQSISQDGRHAAVRCGFCVHAMSIKPDPDLTRYILTATTTDAVGRVGFWFSDYRYTNERAAWQCPDGAATFGFERNFLEEL
jgi:hypothetical protein